MNAKVLSRILALEKTTNTLPEINLDIRFVGRHRPMLITML
jgi:hypothetical protein